MKAMGARLMPWQAWLQSAAPSSRRQARLGEAYRTLSAFLRHPPAVAGLAIILALTLLALLAPLIVGYRPDAADIAHRLAPPSTLHWLGTDELGRDILARLLYGARRSLGIIALATGVAAPVGLLIGCMAGYAGGWVDTSLMRLTDVCLALPRLILALAFVAALGPGIENAILAIVLVAWPPYARIARADSLALRHSDFIAAARLAGASPARIVLRHIMPLCVGSVMVRVSLDMAGVILIAAGLGFLGLGAQPPLPEWGAMIAAGRKYMLDQWWVAAMPGLAIAATSLGFTLLGDGLRDVLDPRRR
jgi:peptide/nickel transport system permease protein